MFKTFHWRAAMKSRVLLLSAIVAATAGLSVGAAQADQSDAQAQAAALLSSSYVTSPAIASSASAQAVQGDAQAQAAALLSGGRISQSDASEQVATSRVERLDAQAHAATLLSGTRSTVQETARTSATTQQLGDHPAVIAARTWSTRGLDPNTFVVAHPARLELVAASPSETEDAQRTDVQARLGR
jgi:hypothetical protein